MTDSASIRALRRVPLFASLDEESLEALAKHSRRRVFRSNEAIFHEGDSGHSLFVIVSGQVNIQTATTSGETVHIAIRGPGEHFGELSLIDQKPRMADAITIERSDLLILEREAFIRCIKRAPQVAIGVMASLADRLREAAEQRESQQNLTVSGRLAEALLSIAKEHGVPAGDGSILINTRVTQDSLAERIGCKRETVNRAFSGLRATGAITTEGRLIFINDAQKLGQYSAK